VELRTRAFFSLVITIVFAGFFAYSYPQDIANGAVWSLAIDGVLLAIALFSLVDFVRCCIRINSAKREAESQRAVLQDGTASDSGRNLN
jgi:hypothetical protein